MSHESVQARAIFIDAVENVPPERWREYLDQACGDDTTLRDKVQRLLDAHGGVGSFMDKPAAAPVATVDQPITEKPGTQVGPYKLLQQLGEGGMGVVYMAEQQQPVKRRVALKIIKPGMDTRQVIARFEAERQALAMMDHPNIAKVLDAGQTESGRPYFVMELVNGISVTEYCDEQHLTPKERLELFVPICQAVQHAHHKGIIHRDLKPTNVLVALYDGQAVPKVIDFGVVKATSQMLTEKTMFTQPGQIVGTLEYMSPEQAQVNQLDVDTRSDIYSLGVLLYELLTGETPFDRTRLRSAAFDEMLRIIREEEPSKPSTKVSSSETLASIAANRRIEPHKLGSTIRGELDWIVMKALEKDRARRYETASKFAEDIQRYLNDEAVVACPPSIAYQLRKFARRNRVAVFIATLIAASLLLGLLGTTWQAARARRAQRTATSNLQLAVDAVNEMLTEVAQQDLKNVPQVEPVRRRLLEKALDFYREFQVRDAAPEIQLGAAQAQVRLGDIQLQLGELESSELAYRRAIELVGAIDPQELPDQKYPEVLTGAYHGLARRQTVSGAVDAQETFEKALQYAEKSDDDEGRQPDRNLALILADYAALLRRQGDTQDATSLYQRAVDLLADRAPHSQDPSLRRQLASVLAGYAVLLKSSGAVARAEQREREAVHLLDSLDSEDREYRDTRANALNNLAVTLDEQGKMEEAMRLYRRALDVQKVLVKDFPFTQRYRHRLARTHGNLGALLWNANQLAEAEEQLKQGIEILRQLAHDSQPDIHSELGGQLHNLALVLQQEGEDRLEGAVTLLKEAIAAQRTALSAFPQHPRFRQFVRNHLASLAELEYSAGRLENAEQSVLAATSVTRDLVEKFPEQHEHQDCLANELSLLAQIKLRRNAPDEAETVLRQVIAEREKAMHMHPDSLAEKNSLAQSWFRLGSLLVSLQRKDDAQSCFAEALQLFPDDQALAEAVTAALDETPDKHAR